MIHLFEVGRFHPFFFGAAKHGDSKSRKAPSFWVGPSFFFVFEGGWLDMKKTTTPTTKNSKLQEKTKGTSTLPPLRPVTFFPRLIGWPVYRLLFLCVLYCGVGRRVCVALKNAGGDAAKKTKKTRRREQWQWESRKLFGCPKKNITEFFCMKI